MTPDLCLPTDIEVNADHDLRQKISLFWGINKSTKLKWSSHKEKEKEKQPPMLLAYHVMTCPILPYPESVPLSVILVSYTIIYQNRRYVPKT